MYKIATATQLVVLIIFAILLNALSLVNMLILALGLVSLLIYKKNSHFFRLIRKLKWFFFVMFLIFLLNTPGEHIVTEFNGVKPTFEGLYAGVAQVLRIVLMLAALSLLLTYNTTQQLVSGLYFLLAPMSRIGVDAKRFAARLWLTLHYVDQQPAGKARKGSITKHLGQHLDDAFTNQDEQLVDVILERTRLTWVDAVVIAGMGVISIAMFVR